MPEITTDEIKHALSEMKNWAPIEDGTKKEMIELACTIIESIKLLNKYIE